MALIKFQLFAGQITRAACQADVLLQWRRDGWLARPATEGHRSCRPEPATDAPGAVPRCLPALSCRTPSTRLQSLLHYSGGLRAAPARNKEGVGGKWDGVSSGRVTDESRDEDGCCIELVLERKRLLVSLLAPSALRSSLTMSRSLPKPLLLPLPDWSEQRGLRHVFATKTGLSLSQSGHMEQKHLATNVVQAKRENS
ncbi:uncharacterized [Tachysurus ichikawai]